MILSVIVGVAMGTLLAIVVTEVAWDEWKTWRTTERPATRPVVHPRPLRLQSPIGAPPVRCVARTSPAGDETVED